MDNNILSESDRLQLTNLMGDDFEDNTELIRKLKHSSILRENVDALVLLLKNNASKDEMETEKFNSCFFLYKFYTEIYNKIVAQEIDVELLYTFIDTLSRIENEELDIHEGSYIVGKLLKKIYIDSAIKKGEKIDSQYSKEDEYIKEVKSISWKEYKNLQS
jgi:hypothetical protein